MRGIFRPGLGSLAVVGALLLAGGVAYRTVVVLASPDAVSLRCIGSVTGGAAFNWHLSAIAVGTVHS